MEHPYVAECNIQQPVGYYTERMERIGAEDYHGTRCRIGGIDYFYYTSTDIEISPEGE